MTAIAFRICHSERYAKNPRICAHYILHAIGTVLLLASAATAQTAPTGLYRIAGTVVSSVDGRLLQNASITIRQQDPSGSTKPITRTATSDEDGRFQFTDLPAGNFTLLGESHNFLLTYYDDHDGFTTGIITGSTVATDALVLKLVPKSSLSGSIRNDAGEPVANAQVRLFRQSHSFGDDRIAPAGTQQTDDLGHFDFASLAPADYLVAVTAQPWYAVHPQPDRSADRSPPMVPANMPADQQDAMRRMLQQSLRFSVFGVTGPLDPSLDVAYPITYYPSGTDSSEAQPIPLRPGDAREISLQLSAVPAVTITIPHPVEPNLILPQTAPTTPEAQAQLQATLQFQARQFQQQIPQLRTSIFGNLERVPAQEISNSPNSTMLTGIPPGDYLVAGGNVPINQSLGATPVHLSASDHSLATTAPDTSAFAHIHIKLESPNGPPNSIRIGLTRAGSNELVIRSTPAKGDTVIDVPPGTYSFTVQPANITDSANARNVRTWFLRGIASDGKPLADNSIHLAAGESPSVTLTIIPGDHTLRGIVVHSPTAGAPRLASEKWDGPPLGTPVTNNAVIPSEVAQAHTAVILSEAQRAESKDPEGSSVATPARTVPPENQSQATPAPGAFLLLIPTADIKAEHRRFWRQQSDLDGSFSIAGLAPGSYTLFAIDDGWTLNWQQPGALDHYLPAAAQISIPDNAPPTVSLPLPIPAQPK
jgi:hypothetical protein